MTAVMIGIDPHKASHTATALDATEVEVARLRVRAGRRQAEQLLAWATPFATRTWAIESANGLGYLLAQQLLAAGEQVVDVPATLAARVRVLGSGRSTKNDPNDARAVAVAAMRAPMVIPVRVEDHRTVLRLLAKHHSDLARWRNKLCCRLHALVSELVAGGISKEVVVSQAFALLEGIHPDGAAAVERHRLARQLADEVVHVDTQLRAARRDITADSANEAQHTSSKTQPPNNPCPRERGNSSWCVERIARQSVCRGRLWAVPGRNAMSDESLAPIGRLLFENEHVRVWANVVESGQESPLHRHDHDYLPIDIEGDRVVHNPVKDGHFPRMEYDVTPGFGGLLRGGVTETAINIGATGFRTIIVELLDNPR